MRLNKFKVQAFLQAISVLILFSFNSQAFALSLPITSYADSTSSLVESLRDRNQYNFAGSVALPNCSGSLIYFHGANADQKAIVLTNGHCVKVKGKFLKPNEIIYNKEENISIRFLKSNSATAGVGQVTKVIYATMTGTDLALLELSQTYNEIYEKYQISPLKLSYRPPQVGTDIRIISGYWKMGYTCKLEQLIPYMKEADWVWQWSLRYSESGCETKGGTSGSPILSAQTNEVIGVNNTGNEDGGRCTLNNPCEIDANGVVKVIKGRSYGQQTYWVYSCLTRQATFDLNVPTCILYKGEK